MRKNKRIKEIELTIQDFIARGIVKGLSVGVYELVLSGLNILLDTEVQKQKDKEKESRDKWRLKNSEKIKQQRIDWALNNPEKVEAARERQNAKLRTGNPPGRPRQDSNHAPGKNALAQREYRKDNEQWKEYNRKKQAEWAAKNPERSKEIKKATIERRKQRLKESTEKLIQVFDSMI